jgi:hypothetical protein
MCRTMCAKILAMNVKPGGIYSNREVAVDWTKKRVAEEPPLSPVRRGLCSCCRLGRGVSTTLRCIMSNPH